ncbi:MAG: SIS domain-containing protein [Sulfolobales archaeon]
MSVPTTASRLAELVYNTISRVVSEEGGSLEKASEAVARALTLGGLEYLFGTGHSMLVALEAFFRAGGLVRAFPILDLSLMGIPSATRASYLERLPGYSKAIVESIEIVPNSVAIIVSNSGKNSGPVEMAIELKSRGVEVIGITSLEYSKKLQPENQYGKKLYEVADIVIDNKVPEGDAAYAVSESLRMFPISTIVNTFIVHAINARAVEIARDRGHEPEVWTSVNVPGGKERNRAYLRKYANILKYI